MPEDLTPFARELIQRCPNLINRFADRINNMIYNWDDKEALDPVTIKRPSPYTGDIQDLLSHVGYDAAQCGYDK